MPRRIIFARGWHGINGIQNIKNIYKKFGDGNKIKTYPYFSILDFIFNRYIRKTEWHSILDMIPYKKNEAMKILQTKFNYKPYPYKHYESILTRFYQGFILPEKFNVDKRKVHLSTLIMNEGKNSSFRTFRRISYPDERI